MAALAFTFYLHAYLTHVQNVSFPLPKLIISVLCGLLALSKTAIISIPIATIVILVININKIGVRTFFKVIGFLGCIIIEEMINSKFATQLEINTDSILAWKAQFNENSK